MKDLLEKAIAFVGEAEAKFIEYNSLVDKNKLLLEKNQKGEAEIERKKVELARRESKIKNIENVVAIEASNIKKAEEIKKDMAQLDVERNAFVGYQEQIKKEHKAKAGSLESSIKAANDKEAKYEKGLKDLKEEKKNLKETILKEIANKIK